MQRPRWIHSALLAAVVLGLNAHAVKAEISFFRLFKTEAYEQTSNAQPMTLVYATGNADIIYINNSDFTDAKITSLSPISPMVLSPKSPTAFGYGQIYTSVLDLNTDVPNDTDYAFGISGGTLGTDSAALSLPATDFYASEVPFFNGTTYDQLQGVDSANAFQFNIDGYAAPVGSNLQLTYFSIFRTSDGASVYTTSGPNTQTSFTLPANTLEPGTAYFADLVYSSRIETPNAGFNGAQAEVGNDLRTDLYFTTAVPEPSTYALAAIGVVGLLVVRRRKARA